MDRRVFLRETVMGAAVVACGVGGLWVRRTRSRGQIVEQLMESARPVLDKHALDEQEQIPGPAGEKIREYFDGIYLNAAEFVGEISTVEYRQKLSKLRKGERRHRELLAVFYRRVPGATEVGEQIHAIARDVGPKLDQHWSECCTEIAARWQVQFQKENGPRFDAKEFEKRVTPMLRLQIEGAAGHARRATDEPGWRDAVRSLSADALEAVPEISLDIGGRKIQLPEFAANASRHVFGKLLDLLSDPKWECQKALTERLAVLGNETGAAFEKEMGRRLNDLRAWRENAVQLVAEQHAAERIGFFGERG